MAACWPNVQFFLISPRIKWRTDQTAADQDPVPEEQRTWTAWDFATYWMSDLINVTTWQIASSAMLVGLSTSDAVVIALLSGLLNALPTVLNGAPGADYHIPFPIAIRSSYGYYFGYFCVVSRSILAIIWFGVNCWFGSVAVTEVSMFRLSLPYGPSTAPSRINCRGGWGHVSTNDILLFALCNPDPLLLHSFHPPKAPFPLESDISCARICCHGALDLSQGRGSTGDLQGIFNQQARVSGSTRAWLWLATFCATTNSWMSCAINMSDFTRMSKSRNAPWSQIPTIPIVRILYAILGIATVGAGRTLYDKDIWSPVEMLPLWTGSGGRFLAFCAGCLWILAQISTNLSANGIPFGHDLMNIWPAYINVRRGSLLCLLFGTWAVVPWKLVSTAGQFLTFMNGYGCVVCAIVSIMIADYWMIRRRILDIPGLYDSRGRYRYIGGVNWRAAITQVLFLAISLPGIVWQISPTNSIPLGFQRIYQLNWFVNTFGPLLLYWALFKLLPDRESTADMGNYAMDCASTEEERGENGKRS
ncbi:related to uracil permease [Fusarium mangiferae]|uniref:Related to uracil permease n=1 Tax=Fusarium mangiferae TaxID=192010 RepID=A0A1L7U2R5_FUSMA|nr:uncharacterized protein FMAN_15164 [Fusarium mangiferae]CVL03492.1 related to uracil permease [Fusarium mangiferae]